MRLGGERADCRAILRRREMKKTRGQLTPPDQKIKEQNQKQHRRKSRAHRQPAQFHDLRLRQPNLHQTRDLF